MRTNMAPAWRRTKDFLRAGTEFVWPSRSIISGNRHGTTGALSPDEWAGLSFLGATVCNRCGLPQDLDLGEDTLCAACLARPPRWNRARAALVYDETSRRPILELKHAGRRDGLKVMGNWMVHAGRDLVADTDLIVPVPLHYRRLVARGYNQAGWLAAAVARQTGTAMHPAVIRRMRATRTQGGLNPRERRRNVAGAFAVPARKHELVTEKHILLVDDVLTTGATLGGCARALLKAGAASVDVLVLARVVRARDVTI